MQNETILVALGANQPSISFSSKHTLEYAITLLEKSGIALAARSHWWRTPAFPAGSGPDFVNAVISVETAMPPHSLLTLLHEVEDELGRVREMRWGPRTCDLDLIAYGKEVSPDLETVSRFMQMGPATAATAPAPDQIILPHPRMHERAFVLVPLCDIAPLWVHPVLGQTASSLLKQLPADAVAEVEHWDG